MKWRDFCGACFITSLELPHFSRPHAYRSLTMGALHIFHPSSHKSLLWRSLVVLSGFCCDWLWNFFSWLQLGLWATLRVYTLAFILFNCLHLCYERCVKCWKQLKELQYVKTKIELVTSLIRSVVLSFSYSPQTAVDTMHRHKCNHNLNLDHSPKTWGQRASSTILTQMVCYYDRLHLLQPSSHF